MQDMLVYTMKQKKTLYMIEQRNNENDQKEPPSIRTTHQANNSHATYSIPLI